MKPEEKLSGGSPAAADGAHGVREGQAFNSGAMAIPDGGRPLPIGGIDTLWRGSSRSNRSSADGSGLNGQGKRSRGRPAAADRRTILAALVLGALYFALSMLSLRTSAFENSLASIGLANAVAVVFLLQARLSNEIAAIAALFIASLAANLAFGTRIETSVLFSVANAANVTLVTVFTRRMAGAEPDLRDLGTLGRFVLIAGFLAPAAASVIAGSATALDTALGASAASNSVPAMIETAIWLGFRSGAIAWFLANSIGMVLFVPMFHLIAQGSAQRFANVERLSSLRLLKRAGMIAGSAVCVIAIFAQDTYPLLFLVLPITLVHAFRLGGLATAVHVLLVAVVASTMTLSGLGPIAQASVSPAVQLHLIQAFIAAIFLTGLPVSAILERRDRLTEELSEQRRELALLADNITDAILKLDNEGVCRYASPSVRDVLGRAPEDFVGKPITERTHQDASERIVAVVESMLDGASEKERLTYRRLLDDPYGMPVFIEADCAVVHDQNSGEREGIIVSARDVTERVELELLLTRARRHAETAAEAKSDFLANMSHEIRTPMNGVLGFAELMLQGELDAEQRRHTQMIVESGRSMMLLLNDILDLSKIEAGQVAVHATRIDLRRTLEECVALHRLSARKKGLDLTLEEDGATGSDDPSEMAVTTDGLRLRQIVLNLIGNAVKFTESGSICVHYGLTQEAMTIRVEDSGIGISPTRIERIFNPFTQGESDTARRFGGTGLGLSISRQLAELLGGFIEVESRPGEGSTFSLTLPTKIEAEREDTGAGLEGTGDLAAFDAASPARGYEPRFTNASPSHEALPREARILLAEDHDVNRLLASEMLRRCGQSVAVAHDGHEAISMVFDAIMRERPFDLVLMDVQMPGCDGYAATRTIRAEGIGPEALPIVALTANAFPEDIAAARDAGMQAHLAKPLVFADLARALQRWLPTRIIEEEARPDESAPGRSPAASEQRRGEHRMPPDRQAAAPESSKNSAADAEPAQTTHSPALVARWLDRRKEAIEAVRAALADGTLVDRALDRGESGSPTAASQGADEAELEGAPSGKILAGRAELASLVHKLAGTAAMFGEAELGDEAARLESALRSNCGDGECEGTARTLLAIAEAVRPAQ